MDRNKSFALPLREKTVKWNDREGKMRGEVERSASRGRQSSQPGRWGWS